MKVALVHDYLNEYGGAERVLEALCEIWPKAPIYTAFVNKNSPAYKRFKNRKIITSFAQNIPFFSTRLYSPLRFLAPLIWGGFSRRFSDFDVVISSASWFVTKGLVNHKPYTINHKLIEVCYCHTPPRYLYGYVTAGDINRNFLTRVYALIVNHFMRVYDFEAAQRVDYFIANSHEVAGRIKKFYRRDSVVIYPPVDIGKFGKGKEASMVRGSGNKSKTLNLTTKPNWQPNLNPITTNGYFLVVSRLVASKNVDIVVEVCAKLGLPLKVVGTGRELNRLSALAIRYSKPTNGQWPMANGIEFIGDVSDDQLISLYQNCRAVIFVASAEDFGLVPVEAMAAGKPVVANAEGGVLESVIDASTSSAQAGRMKGKCTGVYFEPPTSGSLTLAINNFVKLEKNGYFDAKFIRKHAQKFSKERFKREILKFVQSKVK